MKLEHTYLCFSGLRVFNGANHWAELSQWWQRGTSLSIYNRATLVSTHMRLAFGPTLCFYTN